MKLLHIACVAALALSGYYLYERDMSAERFTGQSVVIGYPACNEYSTCRVAVEYLDGSTGVIKYENNNSPVIGEIIRHRCKRYQDEFTRCTYEFTGLLATRGDENE